MSWKSEPGEGAFNGVTEQTVRAFPGGSVTDSVMIGVSMRNTDTVEHLVVIRHLKAATYSEVWSETVPVGKALQGPVPCVGLDAANESIVIALGEAITTSNPRWSATFVDRTP